MRTQRWINILLTLAMVLLLCIELAPAERECEAMSIQFVDSTALDYGAMPAAINNLAQKTITGWITVDADAVNSNAILGSMKAGVEAAWYFRVRPADGLLWYNRGSSGTTGQWTGTSELVNGTRYFVAMSYDAGALTNDPVFYINGVSDATIDVATPTGAFPDQTTYNLWVGGYRGAAGYGTQTLSDNRLYNRILTPADVMEIYASRSFESVPRGLVFQMRGYGAAGIALDGATLGASNYVVDHISGAIGTPSGSPILRAETLLNCNP